MTKQVQRRRGTATQHTSFTGAEGETSINTTNKSVHVHDGATAGGIEAARADLVNVSDASLNAALTGNTVPSLTITTADINGGTVDGTVIGGTTAAAVTGTTITGTSFASTGDMTFGDNDKAIFGAGSDLQIYHDGDDSYVTDVGGGDLIIDSNGNAIRLKSTNGENMIVADTDGSAKLFYDGNQKLFTTATGVDITGTLTSDGLTVDGSGTALDLRGNNNSSLQNSLRFTDTDPTAATNAYVGAIEFFSTDRDGVVAEIAAFNTDPSPDSYLVFRTAEGASLEDRLKIWNTGDISFYEDTGTTPKMVWKSADQRLGIDGDESASSLATSVTASVLELNGSSAGSAASWFGSVSGGGHYVQSANSAGTTSYDFLINPYGGNVGIGTSSPATVLDVVGAGNPTITLRGSAGAYTSVLEMNAAGGGSSVINATGASSDNLIVKVTGSERMRIDSSGHAIIPAGVTLGTSAGVYSADNTLDDYEEGTWTPIYYDANAETGLAGVVYNGRRYGKYTKIGNLVTVYFQIITDAMTLTGASSNDVWLSGLPFPVGTLSNSDSNSDFGSSVEANSTSFNDKPVRVEASAGFTGFILRTSTATFEINDMQTGSFDNNLQGSITYPTNA